MSTFLSSVGAALGLRLPLPGGEYASEPMAGDPWPELHHPLHVFVVDVKRRQVLYRVGAKNGPLTQSSASIFAMIYPRKIALHRDALPP